MRVWQPFHPAHRTRPAEGRSRRFAGVLAVACAGLAAAGCGEQKLSGSELVAASRAVSVDVGRALALPPPGSLAVTGVTQRSYDNAVSQVVSLATRGRTPGENAIYVDFFTAADLPDGAGVEGNLLKEPGLDDLALAREMEERLPGVAMSPSALFVQNRYGPFGYAFGHGIGGEACLYAWQRIASGDSIFRPRSGLISVRLRACEPGGSEVSLLRLAYDYGFNASLRRTGWNPIGDAPAPQPGLGKAGVPIYPVPLPSVMSEHEAGSVARPRPARAPRTERSRPPAAEPLPDKPLPDKPLEGYPTVPPPPAP